MGRSRVGLGGHGSMAGSMEAWQHGRMWVPWVHTLMAELAATAHQWLLPVDQSQP